nr:MAG TPA: hypothetical protein [Caudoviricetes sp.]
MPRFYYNYLQNSILRWERTIMTVKPYKQADFFSTNALKRLKTQDFVERFLLTILKYII